MSDPPQPDVRARLKVFKKGVKLKDDLTEADDDDADEDVPGSSLDFNRLSLKDPGRFLHSTLEQMATYMRQYGAEETTPAALRFVSYLQCVLKQKLSNNQIGVWTNRELLTLANGLR